MELKDEDIKKNLFKIAEKAANQDDIYFDGHASTELSQLLHNVVDLINRQQAEIERLNGNLFTISNACMQRVNEAIKEFAERLKEKQRTFIGDEYAYEYIPSIEIDVLLAEKAGEQDEKENICI